MLFAAAPLAMTVTGFLVRVVFGPRSSAPTSRFPINLCNIITLRVAGPALGRGCRLGRG